jgi:guanidinopropionase
MTDTAIPLSELSIPMYSGVPTLLRAPHRESLEGLDIALVGVPSEFTLYRNGTRLGPNQMRAVSAMVRPVNGETLLNPHELCTVADVGDAPVNPLNLAATNALLQEYYESLAAADVRPVSAGGDHGVTLPILRAIGDPDSPVAILQIDSHHDTHGSIFGEPDNHASFVRRVIEEGIVEPTAVFQVGIRGTLYNPNDLDWAREHGVNVMRAEEFFDIGLERAVERMLEVVGDRRVYITIDLDGVDPTIAPGTGVPEPAGLSHRDCRAFVQALGEHDVIGADVVELSPPLDPTGGTARIATNLLFEELCVVAAAITRARG